MYGIAAISQLHMNIIIMPITTYPITRCCPEQYPSSYILLLKYSCLRRRNNFSATSMIYDRETENCNKLEIF